MMMMLGTAQGLEVWLSTISRLDYGGGKGKVRPTLSLSLMFPSQSGKLTDLFY